jgi:tellurite resistance protein
VSEVSVINHHTALIYVMVLVSASDGDMTDAELSQIGNIVTHLPVFRDFDPEHLSTLAASCTDLLQEDDGLDTALALVREALPEKLHETAYALACDVAAADGHIQQEEMRLLEIIRHELSIDRLPAAAIGRGTPFSERGALNAGR